MSVRIQLDNPHTFYTNLDFISGKILLSLNSDESVSAIFVKLEGESRTILMRPLHPGQGAPLHSRREQRQATVSENHKILYKVNQVFPTAAPSSPTSGLAYTLRAGQHVYPFQFKIPFNNSCHDPNQQANLPGGSGFSQLYNLGGLQQLQYRHVKRTLPPSLTGFPGEAEIRYYIKVTVQRPSLFKENRRSAVGFRFLPIEPPRPPPTTNETYARRPYAFQVGGAGYASKKGGLFGKQKPASTLSSTPPKGEVDARLPSPAILTCNQPVPLRIVLRKTAESPEHVFLVSLQVMLIGSTEVRAANVVRSETSTWILLNVSGQSLPVISPSDPLRMETVMDNKLWQGMSLPNTVAPSFHTCNLSRKYELEVKVGLGYGFPGDVQLQHIILPLRFQVEVYSGISPPAALLDAIASQPASTPQSQNVAHTASVPVSVSVPAPSTQQQQQTHDALYPPQAGPNGPNYDDAPPSYEDAMADEISPADGPRPGYSGVTDVNAPDFDEKAGARGSGGGGGAVV